MAAMIPKDTLAEVTCAQWDEKDKGCWDITFKLYSGMIEFVVEEPYMHTYEEWVAFTKGEGVRSGLDFYQGNGDGYVDLADGMFIFVAGPSGAGGDVRLTTKAPSECIVEPLLAALKAAKDTGLTFKPDSEPV